jgi:hypothetical protein
MKTFDKNKLKIKYIFNLYKYSPVYPTTEDILYEYIAGLEKRNLLQEEFSLRLLRRFSSKLPNNITSHKEMMNYFVSKNIFEITKEDKRGTYFKLKNNPWQ